MSARILVVDDEPQIGRLLKTSLGARGYEVAVASDGQAALDLAASWRPDLILLDLGLPIIDGLEVCRQVRAWSQVPIIVLTVRDAEQDKVAALDLGADDYLTKPFAFQELVARVRALLRRRTESEPAVLRIDDLRLDPARRTVTRGDEKIDLTPREFALLDYFMRNPGRVLTRTMIAEHVWDYSFDTSTNVIDVYVNYLRKKIDSGREPKLLHTIRGVGYVLKAD